MVGCQVVINVLQGSGFTGLFNIKDHGTMWGAVA